MENWKETDTLERDIILSVHKKPKTITEISKEVKRAKPTISKTINRMENQDLITKIHNYEKDARKTEVSINPKRIKIEKTHTFYLIYFILSSVPLIISLILSLIFKKHFLVIGCGIGILPSVLFMIYQVYIRGDKVIVEKNPKTIKKEKPEEPENLLD